MIKNKRNRTTSRKSTSIFEHLNLELREIKPLTDNQELTFDGFINGNCMLLLGSAGTGKSFQAVYHSLRDIAEGRANKLIIVRSPVTAVQLGFMPGNLAEKGEVFEDPYVNIVNELFGRADAYGILKKHNIIEFMLTSHVRGITIDYARIVFDEIQNSSFNELSTLITRAGKGTLTHFCGDFHQTDLKERDRALHLFTVILDKMPEFRSVVFTIHDCVRSGLARSFLFAQHKIYGDALVR